MTEFAFRKTRDVFRKVETTGPSEGPGCAKLGGRRFGERKRQPRDIVQAKELWTDYKRAAFWVMYGVAPFLDINLTSTK
jgi:hypothetical protein